MIHHLVIAIFSDEAAADAAAVALTNSAGLESAATGVDTYGIQNLGVIALDKDGQLKTEKLGPRHALAGAGIGLILAAVTPVGLVLAVGGGLVLGARNRRGLGLSDAERERLGRELQDGRAAVGVLTDATGVETISARLAELGGLPETHELDQGDLATLDDVATADAAEASASSVSPTEADGA
jgi:hypothetical protein